MEYVRNSSKSQELTHHVSTVVPKNPEPSTPRATPRHTGSDCQKRGRKGNNVNISKCEQHEHRIEESEIILEASVDWRRRRKKPGEPNPQAVQSWTCRPAPRHVRHLDEDLFCGTSTAPTVLRRPGRCTPCPGRLVRNRPPGAQQGHVNLVDAGLVQEDHDALDPVRDQLSRPSHSAESMECLLGTHKGTLCDAATVS